MVSYFVIYLVIIVVDIQMTVVITYYDYGYELLCSFIDTRATGSENSSTK